MLHCSSVYCWIGRVREPVFQALFGSATHGRVYFVSGDGTDRSKMDSGGLSLSLSRRVALVVVVVVGFAMEWTTGVGTDSTYLARFCNCCSESGAAALRVRPVGVTSHTCCSCCCSGSKLPRLRMNRGSGFCTPPPPPGPVS